MIRFGSFIITFNRPAQLKEAIQRTLAQTHPPDCLLIVDNGDPEKTKPVIREFTGPNILYHSLGENLGPAGASAYALQKLVEEGHDWIAFGDDDTPPRIPDTFERLLNLACRETNVGGVGAVGARFDWTKGELHRLPDQALQGVVEVDGIGTGQQLIVSREVIKTVGLPNSRLFFGFYDPEYCLRIRRAGYRLLVEGELMHKYREKTGRLNLIVKRSLLPRHSDNSLWRRYYVTRNYIFMMQQTFKRPDLARREALKALGRTLSAWGRGPRYAVAFSQLQLRGIFDGYCGRLGRTVLPKAKKYD
ncbi:glycosyltransferase [bacterium]|nr:glycosyltransferase [bacterium]